MPSCQCQLTSAHLLGNQFTAYYVSSLWGLKLLSPFLWKYLWQHLSLQTVVIHWEEGTECRSLEFKGNRLVHQQGRHIPRLCVCRQRRWRSGQREMQFMWLMIYEDMDHPHLNCLVAFLAVTRWPWGHHLDTECYMSVCLDTGAINQGSGNTQVTTEYLTIRRQRILFLFLLCFPSSKSLGNQRHSLHI